MCHINGVYGPVFYVGKYTALASGHLLNIYLVKSCYLTHFIYLNVDCVVNEFDMYLLFVD